MRSTHRIGSLVATTGLVLAGLGAAAPAGVAAPAPDTAQKPVRTGFAFGSVGYGTLVRGGQVPVGSDTTSYSAIGCTVRAGVQRGNYEAELTVPGLGKVYGVRTRLWTEKKGKVVSSYSTHSVAEVRLVDSPLGRLTIEGVRSLSRAFHDAKGFHTDTQTSVAKIVFTPPVGDPQVLDLPTPGQPIEIPGLAKIEIGHEVRAKIEDGIRAAADAIAITVIPTSTKVLIAHSAAKIQKGAPFGTYRGYSAGVRVRAAADNLKVGRTPLSVMPCKGTKGKTRTKGVAHLNLADQLVVRGVDTAQMGRQSKRKATAFERGSIAKVNLGDGALIINGIVAKANVTRVGNKLVRNAKGTTIGSIVAGGETYEFPRSGVIEIPGLVKIEDQVVRKLPNGLSVVALRLTLLDGSGAVVDLGIAQVQIRRG